MALKSIDVKATMAACHAVQSKKVVSTVSAKPVYAAALASCVDEAKGHIDTLTAELNRHHKLGKANLEAMAALIKKGDKKLTQAQLQEIGKHQILISKIKMQAQDSHDEVQNALVKFKNVKKWMTDVNIYFATVDPGTLVTQAKAALVVLKALDAAEAVLDRLAEYEARAKDALNKAISLRDVAERAEQEKSIKGGAGSKDDKKLQIAKVKGDAALKIYEARMSVVAEATESLKKFNAGKTAVYKMFDDLLKDLKKGDASKVSEYEDDKDKAALKFKALRGFSKTFEMNIESHKKIWKSLDACWDDLPEKVKDDRLKPVFANMQSTLSSQMKEVEQDERALIKKEEEAIKIIAALKKKK